MTAIGPASGLRSSVAMCTYNGARHLPEQLRSIAGQTIAPFELVVQDDASTDDTVALLAAFADRVTFPVRVLVNEHRLGPFANFSACMARCDGDIVVLTDQDDVWLPDRLERTEAAFAAAPDLTFTFADMPLIDDAGASLGRTLFDTLPMTRADRRLLDRGDGLTELPLRYGLLYGTTLAARTTCLRDVLPVPAGWSHDEWITFGLSVLGRSARLAPVTHYRQHAAQCFGAGTTGVAGMTAGIRSRDDAFYQKEIARFEASVKAVRGLPAVTAALLPMLKRKLAFLRTRAAIRVGGPTRVLDVARLAARGDYVRFGGGLRSVARDVTSVFRR